MSDMEWKPADGPLRKGQRVKIVAEGMPPRVYQVDEVKREGDGFTYSVTMVDEGRAELLKYCDGDSGVSRL